MTRALLKKRKELTPPEGLFMKPKYSRVCDISVDDGQSGQWSRIAPKQMTHKYM